MSIVSSKSRHSAPVAALGLEQILSVAAAAAMLMHVGCAHEAVPKEINHQLVVGVDELGRGESLWTGESLPSVIP